jgi:signal transduction histidine kinase
MHEEFIDMRLHDFILTEREQILAEWERFATTCSPASITMDVAALRDHAGEMLLVIAADLKTYQGGYAQSQKSKGLAPVAIDAELTAAEEHGAGRADSGFTMVQMVAEYRALRASVLKLWTRQCGALESEDIADLMRFNEAVDQSLAESVSEFTESVENAKEMFLAILGHDLRSPLGAIYTSALVISESVECEKSHRDIASQIAQRAMRATQMVGDLLDFTRSRLGGGIPVHPVEVDLRNLLVDVAEEIMDAHPGSSVQVEAGERQVGQWDAARISQVLTNLLSNAVEHGGTDDTIGVRLDGDEETVVIRIHNRGATISADRLDGLFNPMKLPSSLRMSSGQGPTGNLGLGLYIAERIVTAHGGSIEVASSPAQGTTFSVHLPRADSLPEIREQQESSGTTGHGGTPIVDERLK